VKNKEVDITSRYESLNRNNVIGDFKFVVLEKFLSYENDELPFFEKLVMNTYFLLKRGSLSEARLLDRQQFGEDRKFPLLFAPPRNSFEEAGR